MLLSHADLNASQSYEATLFKGMYTCPIRIWATISTLSFYKNILYSAVVFRYSTLSKVDWSDHAVEYWYESIEKIKFSLSCLCSPFVFAESIDCSNLSSKSAQKPLVKRVSNLISFCILSYRCPLKTSTRSLWFKHTQQCKNTSCFQQIYVGMI